MPVIKIQISAADYSDLLNHLSKRAAGQRLVAVVRIVEGPDGESQEELLDDYASEPGDYVEDDAELPLNARKMWN
jgi:hypothetical protein